MLENAVLQFDQTVETPTCAKETVSHHSQKLQLEIHVCTHRHKILALLPPYAIWPTERQVIKSM